MFALWWNTLRGSYCALIRARRSYFAAPYDVEVRTSLWGTRASLLELVGMAKRGEIRIETQTYPISEALQAYAALHDGKVRGRAVVVP